MTRSSLSLLFVPLTTLLAFTTADFSPYPNGTPPSTPTYNILTALEAAGVATTDLPSLSNTPATNPAETTTLNPVPTDALDTDTATPTHASIAFPTNANVTVLSLATSYNRTTNVRFPNSTNADGASPSQLLTAQDLSNSTTNGTQTNTTATKSTFLLKNGTFASLPSSISKLRLTNNGTTINNSTLPALDTTNSTLIDPNTNLTSPSSAAASPPFPFLPASSSAPPTPASVSDGSGAGSSFTTLPSGSRAVGNAVAATATPPSPTGAPQQATFVTSGGQRKVVGGVGMVLVALMLGEIVV